ncbi:MAG: zinc ribbon domain-containing protein [candidate division Zixibacteria bacterium]|nr:zinc ribbon domain-containing protein [candidate division Zixibacteria bacterium]
MPYCPECEYRYPPDVEVCPDCATPLVASLDAGAVFVCDECKEPVTAEASWCANCGTVFVENLCCFLHPDTPAHGHCVACGQFVCPKCAHRQAKRYFCIHDAQEELPPVGSKKGEALPSTDWEGVLYSRHLNHEGIESRPFSHEHDTRRVCGTLNTLGVHIVVPIAVRRRVAAIFKQRDITQEVALFECDRCSAISRIDDLACPNCGK